MSNYSLGKIYKIYSHKNINEVYVGSTTNKYLSSRLCNEKHQYKNWKIGKKRKMAVFDLFDKYGVDTCYIYLIEDYPCNSKDALHSREEYWRQQLNCVNVQAAFAKNRHKRDNWPSRQQIKCPCGSTFKIDGMKRHQESQRHQEWLVSQKPKFPCPKLKSQSHVAD